MRCTAKALLEQRTFNYRSTVVSCNVSWFNVNEQNVDLRRQENSEIVAERSLLHNDVNRRYVTTLIIHISLKVTQPNVGIKLANKPSDLKAWCTTMRKPAAEPNEANTVKLTVPLKTKY